MSSLCFELTFFFFFLQWYAVCAYANRSSKHALRMYDM